MNTRFSVVAIVAVCLAGPLRAEEGEKVRSPDEASYCGLYSLHRAMQALHKDIPFRELLTPEYIGSRNGSSVEELVRASSDFGLYAEPAYRVNYFALAEMGCPAILHVKQSFESKEYNHWVLFAGTRDGKAVVYDGTGPESLVSRDDLSARWDGIAILVSNEPISHAKAGLLTAVPVAAVVALIALALAAGLHMRWRAGGASGQRRRLSFTALKDVGVICGVSAIVGAAFAVVNPGGYLSSGAAIAGIRDSHFSQFLPKVRPADTGRLLGASDVTVVDARLEVDFANGHLDGAVNIPPSFQPEQVRQAVSGVPMTNRILIYCQSDGCPFSERVARKLDALGHYNLIYMEEGWVGWTKLRSRPAQ